MCEGNHALQMCVCLSISCNYCSPSFCAWCLDVCTRATVLFKCVYALAVATHAAVPPFGKVYDQNIVHSSHSKPLLPPLKNQTKLTPYSTWALAQAYMQAACMRILSHIVQSLHPITQVYSYLHPGGLQLQLMCNLLICGSLLDFHPPHTPPKTRILIPSPTWAPASAHVQPTRTWLFA